MGFFNSRKTGEKCLSPGIYNPEHRDDNTVNLMITKGEIFPSYNSNNKTVWKQTGCFCVLLREFLKSDNLRN